MIHGHESGNKSALEIFPSILATRFPPDAVVFKKTVLATAWELGSGQVGSSRIFPNRSKQEAAILSANR
jgi:hypothetical protein